GRIVVDDRVFFDARAGVDLSSQSRRIGYVFQGYALFPHLTVADNVGFGLRNRSRAERHARTGAIIARLGLSGLEGRYPRELSGGYRPSSPLRADTRVSSPAASASAWRW